MAATVAAAALMAAWPAAAENPPAYLANFPNFAPNLTPAQLPGDVDTTLKKKLDADRKFAEVQRLFDLWSWQAFVSLNWPTDKPGHPLSDAKDYSAAPPDWTLWTESTDVFRPKGERPPVCGKSAAELLTFALTPTAPTVPPVRGLEAFKLPPEFNGRKTRLLGNISAVGEVNAVNPGQPNAVNQLADINQAFSGPLVDQNGNFVYYEILIDPHEVKYICDNNLYSIDGQIQFAAKGGKVTLPSGVDTQDSSGAFELKLAWKILTAGDDPARYLTLPAIVATAVNGKQVETQVTVGLVGMHIAHKSDSSPQWIWATFEQVDNLEVDAVAHPGLKPSFFDPGCEICVPNQEPHKNPDGSWTNSPKTQASRGVPIPKDKQDLNAQARLVLAKIGSPLQYYQLIDTQWPTEPKAPPSPWNAGLPDAITNKPGGHPTPVYLTNITMETYFQKGVQSACRQEETPGNLDCPPPPITYPAPGTISDGTKVFGTESCMGCHSSAGIYISDSQQPKKSGQLTGDFSWLFTQKAQ
ncbi:MAG TPA: hypothetical protein VME69_15645 [Methylocella sp.]|nr:hypothetical protein [Methylocella sp.]